MCCSVSTYNEQSRFATKTPTATGSAYLQAGAFRNQDSAFALRDQLKTLTGQAVNVDSIGGFSKVRIGPLDPAESQHQRSC
ncbi:MAG: SPOR domain-containing protein [Cellvibrionales bacterium]|nr:SPOR domain-containing protein [Cellvibrionales bacterium]